MEKGVIIFIGPPGSGKDTQADILSGKINFFRLRTSRLLEEKFNNVKKNDPDYEVLAREKKLWKSGKLTTPKWVAGVVLEKIDELAQGKNGIIFSASPRTIYEAEKIIPRLEELYGKNNLVVLHITLSEEESVKRNSKRFVCQNDNHPIDPDLVAQGIDICPDDGGRIVKREGLDDPQTILIRFKEYLTRTTPILDYISERGVKIIKVNGEQPIKKVAEDIANELNL